MEEFTEIIVLTDDNGQDVEFEQLGYLEHEGSNYVMLAPVDVADDEELEVVILRMIGDVDSDEVTLEGIEDEALLDELFQMFIELAEE